MRLIRSAVTALALGAAVAAGCDSTFTAETSRSLTVPNAAGSAVLVTSSNGAITLEVDPSRTETLIEADIRAGGSSPEAAAERLAQTQILADRSASGRLEVQVLFPQPRSGRDRARLHIVVPEASGAELRSSNGDLTISDVAGPVLLVTSNGDIAARDIEGPVEARSSNGAIRVEEAEGRVEARSSNGRVVVESAPGPVVVETSNGSVQLVDVGGPIDVATSNGSVTLKLRENFGGVLELSTSNGGIRTVGPVPPEVASVTLEKRRARFEFKAPGESSRVRTSNGGVEVSVSPAKASDGDGA